MRNDIYYEEYGQGTPIYFIHGQALNLESMKYFYESQFTDNRFRRIYLDIPGMGLSPSDNLAPNSDAVLSEIAKFIFKHTGDVPIRLCGHSYGGYLALALNDKLGSQIESIFLTCPVVHAIKSQRKTAQHRNINVEIFNPTNNKKYFSDYLEMNVLLSSKTWLDYQSAILPGILQYNNPFWLNMSQADYQLTSEKLLLQNKAIKGYTLVGKNDQIVGYDEQVALLQSKQMKVVVVDNCGHNLMIDQPAILNRYFQKFISK